MKTSYYCIPVYTDDLTLLFDSMSKTFISLTSERFMQIYSDDTILQEKLSNQERELFRENGLLVDDDIDQRAMVIAAKHQLRLQKTSYHIIINPTLDCNLCCWYCYESHIKNSRLTTKYIDAICRHITHKFQEDHFSELHLSFFGGEPLIASKEIASILRYAHTFCNDNAIALSVHFTTNGTIYNSEVFELLKEIPSTFQITLDGSRAKHNKIRHFKDGSGGSFDTIAKNTRMILENLSEGRIVLRINYDAKTLLDVKGLLAFIRVLPSQRVRVALHKVWQVGADVIDEDKLLDLLFTIKELGFYVDVQGYPIRSSTCYADCLNSCVINYNGDVYKCTARDFKAKTRCGQLTSQGIITWDYEKLKEYCFSPILSKCKTCKLLPICPGICSQQVIENGDTLQCVLDSKTSLEDIVLMRYYLTATKNKDHEV